MLHLVESTRAYDPQTIAVMTAAFDRVCQSVSKQLNDNDDVKQTLAMIILRHVDRGERDPQRLADVALREWTGADRATVGQRSALRQESERSSAPACGHEGGTHAQSAPA
jgi:hypothetical protein